MSISTKTGDLGKTALVGGTRVSKADPRVEAYGTLDELSSVMGFARSICRNEKIREATKAIQKELFTVSASLATDRSKTKKKDAPGVTQEMVDALTRQVGEIESLEGILGDWALPGEDRVSAAYDVARTVCRRAERSIVRLQDGDEAVDPLALAYVNRLSDLLWLFGRLVEKEAGVDARLRDDTKDGPNWSRAW
jgi:cob(I)alamin adenosyltransferase